MDSPILIVSICMGNSIRIQRVSLGPNFYYRLGNVFVNQAILAVGVRRDVLLVSMEKIVR